MICLICLFRYSRLSVGLPFFPFGKKCVYRTGTCFVFLCCFFCCCRYLVCVDRISVGQFERELQNWRGPCFFCCKVMVKSVLVRINRSYKGRVTTGMRVYSTYYDPGRLVTSVFPCDAMRRYNQAQFWPCPVFLSSRCWRWHWCLLSYCVVSSCWC